MTPDQDLSARLAGCHFCGGYCTEIADVSVAEYPYPKFQVQCVACGLSGPIATSENEAAKLWNMVHTNHLAAVQAAVAKAVEACAVIADGWADGCKRNVTDVSPPSTQVDADLATLNDGGYQASFAIAAAIRSRGVSAPVTPANEGGV